MHIFSIADILVARKKKTKKHTCRWKGSTEVAITRLCRLSPSSLTMSVLLFLTAHPVFSHHSPNPLFPACYFNCLSYISPSFILHTVELTVSKEELSGREKQVNPLTPNTRWAYAAPAQSTQLGHTDTTQPCMDKVRIRQVHGKGTQIPSSMKPSTHEKQQKF